MLPLDPPKTPLAMIGGAVTRALRFPNDLNDPDVEIVATDLVYDTPSGISAPFKHLRLKRVPEVGGGTVDVLYLRYLGVRSGATRRQDTEAAFHVFAAAGVQRIVTDDNMGSLNPLLDPGDLVVCHDFIDFFKEASVAPLEGKLVRMREAYCPSLRKQIVATARASTSNRVFRRGVYAVSHGTRFESPSEIQMYRQAGGDIVGYSVIPTIYLARALGICYAGLYLVSNYGEGLIEDWDHESVWQESDSIAPKMGQILLDVLKKAPLPADCGCAAHCTPRPPGVVNYPDK